ncbi:lysine transporter LysE [Priestia sp. YIM B13446]|uniref:lysine transporter LysE n=1 Tax=unclassified Priestia TaxID=2800374 RepID=UPI00366C5D9E
MPLLSFLLYIFVTSFTPGPNNIMAMLFANKYGLRKTTKFCLGVGAGFLVVMLLCSYFNVLLQNSIPKIEFFMGMLLQFINPKGILYGITAIATFILPYHNSNFSLIMYSLFLAFVGFVSTFCWSLFGSVFQKFLSKYKSQFNIVMALLLMYSAVSILIK